LACGWNEEREQKNELNWWKTAKHGSKMKKVV
jgi:hypothetical protein